MAAHQAPRPWDSPGKNTAVSRDDGGVSWVFWSWGASVGFLTRYDGELREPLVWRQGIESLVGILIGIALNLYINNQLTHNSLPFTEILIEDRPTLQA